MAEVARPKARIASGVITASLTPLRADGGTDVAMLAAHCRSLLDQGCTSVVVMGTTGEANSFTVAERQAIAEGLIAAGIAPDKLIVGTGCCAAYDTVALTKHALSLGIARALVLPPFYYKNVGDDGLFAALAATIEQVNDDRLRLFLYLIPQMTGIEIGADLVERLYDAYPQAIAGLKDSSGRWESAQTLCARLGSRIDVMVGTEALMLQALAAGASGCITALGNAFASQIVRLYEQRASPSDGSLADRVMATRRAFESFPVIPALKAYLAHQSGVESWSAVRPPLLPLSPANRDELVRRLAHAPAST